jgi:hypothetical protein
MRDQHGEHDQVVWEGRSCRGSSPEQVLQAMADDLSKTASLLWADVTTGDHGLGLEARVFRHPSRKGLLAVGKGDLARELNQLIADGAAAGWGLPGSPPGTANRPATPRTAASSGPAPAARRPSPTAATSRALNGHEPGDDGHQPGANWPHTRIFSWPLADARGSNFGRR